MQGMRTGALLRTTRGAMQSYRPGEWTMKRILRPDVAFGLGVGVAWVITGKPALILAGSCVAALSALHHLSMGFYTIR